MTARSGPNNRSSQLVFLFDRIRELASQHPEWKDLQPFKAVLENDMKALAAAGMDGLMQLAKATHAGMTTEEFERIVKDWIATARHPRFERPCTEVVYQPMLEVLAFLRGNATLRGRLRIRGWLQVLARIVSPGWAHGGPLTLTRLQCGRRTGGNILRSGSGRRLKIPAIVQRAGFGDFRTSGRVVEAAASVSAATVLAVASRTAEGCGLSGLSCTAGCEGCL
jgi:hypothetical protein